MYGFTDIQKAKCCMVSTIAADELNTVENSGKSPRKKIESLTIRDWKLLLQKEGATTSSSSFGCSHLSGVATADVFKHPHRRFDSVLRQMPF